MTDEFIHTILIDDDEQPEGWRVWCVPHGYIGAWSNRVEAVLKGLEHDVEYNGKSCR